MNEDEIRKQVQSRLEGAAARFRTPARGMERGFNFKMKAKTATGELYLYDEIGAGMFGCIGAKDVIAALDTMKDCKAINVYINSPGGDVFEATAIYNVIDRFPGKKTCYIDGLAASAASYIPMVADKIITAHNAMWMIHNPWGFAMGESGDMRKAADMLDQVTDILADTYAKRTKTSVKEIHKWMDAETWMDAATAKARGFSDSVTGAADCACTCAECQDHNCVDCSCEGCPSCDTGDCAGCGSERATAAKAFSLLTQYKNTPENLRAKSNTHRVRIADAEAYTIRLKLDTAKK